MTQIREHLQVKPAHEMRHAIQVRAQQEQDDRRHREAMAAERQNALANDFLTRALSEAEWAAIHTRIDAAVEAGRYDAMIASFPSDFCTDSGRAINNRHEHWPETLRGQAREIYAAFLDQAKPAGYRLKATIINFPDGVPGDVGLFLDWSSDQG